MGIQKYLRHQELSNEKSCKSLVKSTSSIVQYFFDIFKTLFGTSLFSSKKLRFEKQHVIIDLCSKDARWLCNKVFM